MKKKEITAAEFMAELESDANYVKQNKDNELLRQAAIRATALDSESVLADLNSIGISVEYIEDLMDMKTQSVVIPVLLKHLVDVTHIEDVRCIILRVLGDRACEKVREVLVACLKREKAELSSSLTFAFLDAISQLTSSTNVDDILPLVLDKRFGKERVGMVERLGGIKTPCVTKVLEQLVGDSDVKEEAEIALTKHRKRTQKGDGTQKRTR